MERKNLDLGALREKLAHESGPRYWKSLEELSDTQEFQQKLQREFPVDASVWNDPISRRSFLKVMGASFGLAGLTSCSKPLQKIIPYVKNPEYVVAGKSLFYASALTLGGYARGVLVESHEGRPTKIEGNPDHPYSLGATDVFMQGELLNMYDPDRSKVPLRGDQISTWETFVGEMSQVLAKHHTNDGEGLALLTDNTTSPTLVAQIQAFLSSFPKARWYSYEAVTRDLAR
jgi:molybdopterin-containing oxidoreductase family iron-sulfur binding subunit